MTDIPEGAHKLYATFGLVAEKAQLLEVDAGNVALTWLAVWYKPETITEAHREVFKGIMEDVNRKTLGALLKNVKSIGSFDDAILAAVDEALRQKKLPRTSLFPDAQLCNF